MQILRYNELDITGFRPQYEKTVEQIKRGDFYSAEVKKLTGTPYYRAKLDYANRLLFQIVTYEGIQYALILEVIANHAYEKSRFLNGASVDEHKIERDTVENEIASASPLGFLNPKNPQFYILDKIISFDDVQNEIYALAPPVIIIGSAGSGKTMLTLEKMKLCLEEVLYVTSSPYLVENARNLYYANGYLNDSQTVDFLSYRELLETLQVPVGKEIDFQSFAVWLKGLRIKQDANKLYEEFKGVITGNRIDKGFLSREEYLTLGVKQSIYPSEDRAAIYEVFSQYRAWLSAHHRYDSNLISFEYLSKAFGRYDFAVVDEVQDFTPVQLALILKMLKTPNQFILCGDSNQIVHPNFFSWSKIKTLFYQNPSDYSANLIRILNKNYRNAIAITAIANKLLKIKNARFGSIDKESHYLVESHSALPGEVYALLNQPDIRQEINKTAKSTRFAVIVLREEHKEEARCYFQTPLIFSIYEAKGLEYENIILYNLVSSEEKNFRDIAQNVTQKDLEEWVYGRVKDKSDRSLEVYKFYINALYVAITRAIQNVYWIETLEKHPLFNLLGITPSRELIAIDVQNSSTDEWQKEAHRLELQGKQEQADKIRDALLPTQPTPWQPLTLERLAALQANALNIQTKDKAARLLLFEYALVYEQSTLITALAQVGFNPALKPDKNPDLINRKYFLGYGSANTQGVMRQIDVYGVDFRNVFNQTPLMIAGRFGALELTQQLLEKGANAGLTDNLGRTAFQIILQKALLDKAFAQQKLGLFYAILPPGPLELQFDQKLIKLDAKHLEFFLVHAMIATAHQAHRKNSAFTVDDFLGPFTHFPERIIPERRKRRAYISSLLSKNEVLREGPYNRKLFQRLKRGFYVLNPRLFIRINQEWHNLSQFLGLKAPELLQHAMTTAEAR